MEVFTWKSRFSAQELSSMLLLHNTLHKWTEILEKQHLAQYAKLLFFSFSVTIFLSLVIPCSIL